MSDKHCIEYNKMVRDIAALVEPVGYDLLVNPDATLTVTRKKPKVEVEWRLATTVYKNVMAGPCGQGELYRVVQFRVKGWTEETVYLDDDIAIKNWNAFCLWPDSLDTFIYRTVGSPSSLYIGLDARSNWSAPVLLPESVYSRLDEITKALEDRANGGKG